MWFENPMLSEEGVLQPALRLLQLCEEEGLWACPITRAILDLLVHGYAALGDEANVVKYGTMLGRLVLASTGDDSDLEQLSRLEFYRQGKLWGARKRGLPYVHAPEGLYMDMKHMKGLWGLTAMCHHHH